MRMHTRRDDMSACEREAVCGDADEAAAVNESRWQSATKQKIPNNRSKRMLTEDRAADST
jgi:hypothetical protein